MLRMARSFLVLCLLGFLGFAHAVPPTLHYAGQVAVDGQPFDGQGLFKFALLNADGNESLWSNDGYQRERVRNRRTRSAYRSTAACTPCCWATPQWREWVGLIHRLFAQHGDAALRVWFSDGVNGFQQLSPDRPFASVPYAFSAGSATIGSGDQYQSMLEQM